MHIPASLQPTVLEKANCESIGGRRGHNVASPWIARVDHSSGFSLATVLLGGSGLFVLATLFFGTKGGYYDTDDYDGNGTAH